jgi:hypothetical protein
MLVTLAAILSGLHGFDRSRVWIGAGVGISLSIENCIILLQSLRGVRSHMNYSTPLNAHLFELMAVFGTHDPARMDGRAVGAAVEPDASALAHQGRDGKPISAGRRYASSKLCTILYAYELDRRLRRAGSSKVCIAYDPGFIPEIGMGKQAPAIFRNTAVKFLLRKLGMTMGKMPLSGEALATLAEAPEFAEESGKYFHSNNGLLSEAKSSAASYDEGKAVKLWSDSKELVRLDATDVQKSA